jgi:hypothetical protein
MPCQHAARGGDHRIRLGEVKRIQPARVADGIDYVRDHLPHNKAAKSTAMKGLRQEQPSLDGSESQADRGAFAVRAMV